MDKVRRNCAYGRYGEPSRAWHSLSTHAQLGRVLLAAWTLVMVAYCFVGRALGAFGLNHFTNWAWLLGIAFYTACTVGLFVRPVLRWTMLTALLLYHGLIVGVAGGILAVLLTDDTAIEDEQADGADIGHIMVANFFIHYLPVIVFYIVFGVALVNPARRALQHAMHCALVLRAERIAYVWLTAMSAFAPFAVYFMWYDPAVVYDFDAVSFPVAVALLLALMGTANALLVVYLLTSSIAAYEPLTADDMHRLASRAQRLPGSAAAG
jgi:hypothetical protein